MDHMIPDANAIVSQAMVAFHNTKHSLLSYFASAPPAQAAQACDCVITRQACLNILYHAGLSLLLILCLLVAATVTVSQQARSRQHQSVQLAVEQPVHERDVLLEVGTNADTNAEAHPRDNMDTLRLEGTKRWSQLTKNGNHSLDQYIGH